MLILCIAYSNATAGSSLQLIQAPHSGTPDDTVNFNLLLDDVRAALDELGEETGKF